MSELGPVGERERLVVLDVLRGFALLGVLIGNTFWLYSGRAWLDGSRSSTADTVARWFVVIFVESKAQTLLCLLFGFGFAQQLLRAQARAEPVMGVYLRRMLALFVIGWLHVTLLWWGDVTWGYAIAGFGLLLFRNATNRTRVIAAVMLTFVPFLVAAIPEVAGALVHVLVAPGFGARHFQAMAEAQQHGSYLQVMKAHLVFALVWEVPIYGWYYFWLLGRFLIGYVAGVQQWFARDGADHLPLFRKLLVGGAVIASANIAVQVTSLLGVFDGYELSLAARLALDGLEQLGLLAMAAMYIAIIVLLIQRPRWRRVLGVLAPVGRMPLTTYLSQSLICVTLFYGWGFGWAGHVGMAKCVGLCLAIFVVQIAVSHLWLRSFRFGPAEWVWRAIVYWKRPAMRR
jgi:uncharacterized protein